MPSILLWALLAESYGPKPRGIIVIFHARHVRDNHGLLDLFPQDLHRNGLPRVSKHQSGFSDICSSMPQLLTSWHLQMSHVADEGYACGSLCYVHRACCSESRSRRPIKLAPLPSANHSNHQSRFIIVQTLVDARAPAWTWVVQLSGTRTKLIRGLVVESCPLGAHRVLGCHSLQQILLERLQSGESKNRKWGTSLGASSYGGLQTQRVPICWGVWSLSLVGIMVYVLWGPYS